jgi:hypothetical protein
MILLNYVNIIRKLTTFQYLPPGNLSKDQI